MIPKKFKFLEKLPMNNNGTVDRKELKKVLEKIFTLPVAYFDNQPKGDIISSKTKDVDTVATAL